MIRTAAEPTSTATCPSTASTAPSPAVRARGLRKVFGGLVAVDDLDLTVRPGEVVAFLGPNGAGKSTTLDMILGLTRPDSGTIELLGRAPDQAVREGRAGVIFQDGGLLDDFTVGETLRVVASMQPHRRGSGPGGARLDDIVARTDLGSILSRKVSRCSGGERQRMRLALALLPDPDLLVMDEPTAGMDVSARIAFWETMRVQTRRGRTVLFATHYLEEAASFADRIVIIAHGRLIADGSVDEIRSLGDGALVTATWPGVSEASLGERLATCPAAGSILHAVVHGEHVELRTTDSDAVARWLLTTTPAEHLGISAASLDEVFTALTSDGAESAAPATP
ncbi:ABC transporter ATP-binding protein [Actinomyces sp. ZJ308]|uniref:ABC transporter ATP-binding protein n=1 Tax=Actinomyces sp. ZJ308 TaxID=2708342 RepID=UPI00141FD7BC|nr:ABC transporter ATP-binding protein [Actinomyces sp. ZJ308]